MGACGYYVSERAVFYMTAALTLPALATLLPLARFERLTPMLCGVAATAIAAGG